MARAKSRVNIPHVVGRVTVATNAEIDKILLQIEGRSKANVQANGQIDTGFMLNANYSILTSGQSTFSQVQTLGPKGQIPAEQSQLPAKARGAVANAARYAVYQEGRRSFLYKAAQQVAKEIGGVKLHKAIAEALHD